MLQDRVLEQKPFLRISDPKNSFSKAMKTDTEEREEVTEETSFSTDDQEEPEGSQVHWQQHLIV